MILCPGDSAEMVSIDGRWLNRHGNPDKGREVWADYNHSGLTGELSIYMNGREYKSIITKSSGMTQGDCWRN